MTARDRNQNQRHTISSLIARGRDLPANKSPSPAIHKMMKIPKVNACKAGADNEAQCQMVAQLRQRRFHCEWTLSLPRFTSKYTPSPAQCQRNQGITTENEDVLNSNEHPWVECINQATKADPRSVMGIFGVRTVVESTNQRRMLNHEEDRIDQTAQEKWPLLPTGTDIKYDGVIQNSRGRLNQFGVPSCSLNTPST